MWFERFVIIVPSLSHEFEPWQWGPTAHVDRPSILLGWFGWFLMWFLLFIKQLPVIAVAEVKEIVLPRLRRSAPSTGRSIHRQHMAYDTDTPGEYD